MIVIVTGPLGIGKSTTAWKLLARFERAAMLDLDYIAAIQPFDYYKQADLDYAYATAGVLAAHHVAHGITNLVLNWVLEVPEQLERLSKALEVCKLPIYTFRLTCTPEELERRVRQRNNEDLDFELRRSQELLGILARAAQTGCLGEEIDTTALNSDQVVDLIWQRIHAD